MNKPLTRKPPPSLERQSEGAAEAESPDAIAAQFAAAAQAAVDRVEAMVRAAEADNDAIVALNRRIASILDELDARQLGR